MFFAASGSGVLCTQALVQVRSGRLFASMYVMSLALYVLR